MADRILRAQVDEVDVMVFSVEASDLGWPPGYFPANGDLFLLEDEDAGVPPRCYRISLVGECCNAPEFSLVDCPDNLRG